MDYSTTNIALENICNEYGLKLNFVGMRNDLPNDIETGFYIVNLDSDDIKGHTGTHWTCIIANDEQCYYQDSYGQPPPIEVIIFMRSRYENYYINKTQFQDINSTACGYFCVCTALYVKRKMKEYKDLKDCVNDYLRYYREDTILNDDVLRALFLKLKPISNIVYNTFIKN